MQKYYHHIVIKDDKIYDQIDPITTLNAMDKIIAIFHDKLQRIKHFDTTHVISCDVDSFAALQQYDPWFQQFTLVDDITKL